MWASVEAQGSHTFFFLRGISVWVQMSNGGRLFRVFRDVIVFAKLVLVFKRYRYVFLG